MCVGTWISFIAGANSISAACTCFLRAQAFAPCLRARPLAVILPLHHAPLLVLPTRLAPFFDQTLCTFLCPYAQYLSLPISLAVALSCSALYLAPPPRLRPCAQLASSERHAAARDQTMEHSRSKLLSYEAQLGTPLSSALSPQEQAELRWGQKCMCLYVCACSHVCACAPAHFSVCVCVCARVCAPKCTQTHIGCCLCTCQEEA